MLKVSRNILVVIIWIFLIKAGCHPCHPVITDKGSLSEETLNLIPYKTGQTIRFRHSDGQLISFDVFRETRKETAGCDECCNEILYEVNTTTLTPDYPVFSPQLYVSNFDTMVHSINIQTGRSNFLIPGLPEDQDNLDRSDSLTINGIMYYDVFRLKVISGPVNIMIYADSLYYNKMEGILKIIMTNGESYEIYK